MNPEDLAAAQDFGNLGTDTVQELHNSLQEQGVLNDTFYQEVCVDLPVGAVNEMSGFIPYLPQQEQADSEDHKDKDYGWNEDAPVMELEASERVYRIRREPLAIPYNMNFEGSNIFDQVENEIVPTITRILRKRADRKHLADIIKGNGVFDLKKKVSRDVTTVEVIDKFDNPDTKILTFLKTWVKKTGSNELLLGDDIANHMQSNPNIRDSVFKTDGGAGEISKSRLAEELADHLGLNRVIIGTGGYQKGSRKFDLDIEYAFDGVCCLNRRGNIVRIPWQSADIQYHEYFDGRKKKWNIQGEFLFDIATYDPANTVAFTDVLAE